MFKITDLEMEKSRRSNSFYVAVEWTCDPDDLSYFGDLNTYSKAIAVEKTIGDIESYYETLPPVDLEKDFVEQEDGSFLWTPSQPSPYDLDLLKCRETQGRDKIQQVEGKENTYLYKEWVVDCGTTRAMALQIARMQDNLEKGLDATFRSASVVADFATILNALDLYWD